MLQRSARGGTLVLLSLISVGLAAQDVVAPAASSPKDKPEPKRPAETLSLVDAVRGLPPEFSSDLLLKLASSAIIEEAKWKRELIEEAFASGKQAQLPFPRTAWVVSTDARVNQEYRDNGLAALTLQTRAVEAMLNFDPQRARSMFEDVLFPTLPRLTCQDAAVPRVEAYYDTAANIFARSFSAREREKEDDLRFVEQRIGLMDSPVQVPRVLGLIFKVQVTAEQRKRLLAALGIALERVSGSDRLFGPFEVSTVPGVVPDLTQAGVYIPALRAYIVRQVGGPRCSDYIRKGAMTASVTQFNSLVKQLDPSGSLFRPITEDEAKPLKVEAYKAEEAWQSDRGAQVLTALKWLTHGNRMRPGGGGVLPWTLEERKSLEWSDRCQDTLKLIEGWRETEEASSADYLVQVTQAYATLAELIPPGSLRDAMMRRYLIFLETHYEPNGSRNLWFTQVRRLLSRFRATSQDPEERAWLSEHLLRSSSSIIALYARIETLLGPGSLGAPVSLGS